MCMLVDILRISMFEKVQTIGKPQQFDVFQIEAQQALQHHLEIYLQARTTIQAER